MSGPFAERIVEERPSRKRALLTAIAFVETTTSKTSGAPQLLERSASRQKSTSMGRAMNARVGRASGSFAARVGEERAGETFEKRTNELTRRSHCSRWMSLSELSELHGCPGEAVEDATYEFSVLY